MSDAVEAGEDYNKLELSDPNTMYQYLGGVDGSGYPLEVTLGGTANSGVYDPSTYGSGICEAFVVLSVDLLNFTAEAQESNSLLKWETLSENENDYFEIEWTTGEGDWIQIGKVNGAGLSEEKLYYDFLHITPVNGNNYYRLIMVDFEGNRHVSEPKKVVFESNKNQLIVVPNPNEGRVTILDGDITESTTFMVFDGQGREVQVRTLHQTKGSIRIEHSLPKGVYLVYFADSNQHVKMIVQ